MIQIAVTTLNPEGAIIEHRIAKGEDYDSLIENLENEASQLNLKNLKEFGAIMKLHVTGNITTAVLLP